MAKIISKIENTDLHNMVFTYSDIIDGSIVKNELTMNYGLWSFIHNENVSPKDALQGIWNHFISMYSDDIERIKNALDEQYEILDNYNGSTTTTIGTKTTTNVIGAVNSTISHGATSVTLGGGTDTSTLQDANSESAQMGTYLDNSKTTQVIASKTNTSNAYDDTQQTNEHTDTTTDSGNVITETKHGNLGVATSQSMVESEKNLRVNNNFYRIIIENMFLHNYLFICE